MKNEKNKNFFDNVLTKRLTIDIITLAKRILVPYKRRCGGIGRRKGLKIPRQQCRTGSIPVSGTMYRGVEQLVARRAHNPEAAGSSPVSATSNKKRASQKRCSLFVAVSYR